MAAFLRRGGRGLPATTESTGPETGRLDEFVVSRIGDGTPCGDLYRVYQCPVMHEWTVRRWRCQEERECPECSKLWAGEEGRIVERRLDRFRRRYPPRHVVVSPPQTHFAYLDPAGLRRLLRAAWTRLKEMGVLGGVLIAHPWRKRLRSWGTEWYPGPHVHALVYGKVDFDKAIRGWVVKPERFEQESIARTAGYLLDHAGYTPRGHVPHWYGTCSYNKGGPEPKVREKLECSRCHAEMERVNDSPWDDGDVAQYARLTWGAKEDRG